MRILVTGTAGFIGHRTVLALLNKGHSVVGIDNINDYYDPALKFARLADSGIGPEAEAFGSEISSSLGDYRFIRMDLADRKAMAELFASYSFDAVCHLAAQAGVRYSIEQPFAYADSNLEGFLSILEGCRNASIPRLVYASSSSVYGANSSIPFKESDRVDNPVSLYAATKKSNEMMASSYAHLYGIHATGLRFFTVYGPWGRPDMAPMLFLSAMKEGRKINVFNNGNMKRDFTYIDDIVEGVCKVLLQSPPDDPLPVYNIGRGQAVDLMEFIRLLEEASGYSADKDFMPMQSGDVPVTWADTSCLERDYSYAPSTDLSDGIAHFARWYTSFYGADS